MAKKLSHTIALHIRGARELHTISPRLFPVLALSAAATALIPYAGVFFSAQVLKELATAARAEVLWKWAGAGVLCTGFLAICKAMLHQRYQTLFDDVYGRKEILFCRKMFSLDYADMDKQETHDLRAQIQQNENWSNWG